MNFDDLRVLLISLMDALKVLPGLLSKHDYIIMRLSWLDNRPAVSFREDHNSVVPIVSQWFDRFDRGAGESAANWIDLMSRLLEVQLFMSGRFELKAVSLGNTEKKFIDYKIGRRAVE